MEKHYICLGGCKGVSQVPGVCQAPDCANHNHQLVECGCRDGLHNGFKKKSVIVQVILALIFVLSSVYLVVEIFFFILRFFVGIIPGPFFALFGLLFPVYNVVSTPVFSIFSFSTLFALSGIIVFALASLKSIKVRKYFLFVFIIVTLVSILDINGIRENIKEDNKRGVEMESEAQIHFDKLTKEFSTPATLGDIEIFYHDDPEGGSYVLFAINGKLYDEATGTRTGVGFRYDYCVRKSKEDEILRTYFKEHKKVIVELPKDYSKYTLGYPGSIEIGTTKAGPVLIKDEAGNLIPEFYNLFSRCSYQKLWLPDSYTIEHEQAPPPVVY